MCKFLLQGFSIIMNEMKFCAWNVNLNKYAGLFCDQNVKGGELRVCCGEFYLLNLDLRAAS
jgi:hypothetical protein